MDDEQTNQKPKEDQPPVQKIEASNHSNIQNVNQIVGDYHEHHHYHSEKQPSTPSLTHLPSKTYQSFVGRQDVLERILIAMSSRDKKPITVIVGLGGMGKTALAREAVELCAADGLFDHVVWTSAKTESFFGETTIKTDSIEYSFDSILSEIGRQCNRVDIAKMPLDQKKEAIRGLMADQRLLVVMDNLETVIKNERLVDDIFQLLGQSKLLVTSRHHIKHERGFAVDLSGLPEDEGVAFLKEEGRARGIAVVVNSGLPVLLEIHNATGGAPLAMKLVVGQMSRQPVNFVLSSLKQAYSHGQDYEFYRFIYFQSWSLLSDNSRKVLVDMSVFPPLKGGAIADVEAVSQVEEANAFWTGMDQLVTMSLVDKIGEAGHERFALHPLTHYFILSDITGEWGE
jgi:hypothetical protein